MLLGFVLKARSTSLRHLPLKTRDIPNPMGLLYHDLDKNSGADDPIFESRPITTHRMRWISDHRHPFRKEPDAVDTMTKG